MRENTHNDVLVFGIGLETAAITTMLHYLLAEGLQFALQGFEA
jgi:hypothetical protein